jgi:hypothetical protein
MTAMLLNLPGGIWQNHENFKQNTVWRNEIEPGFSRITWETFPLHPTYSLITPARRNLREDWNSER